MTPKDGHLGPTGSPRSQSRESVSGDAIDRAIDETIWRYFMRHDPSPRTYATLLEAARRASASRRDSVPFALDHWCGQCDRGAAVGQLVLQVAGVTAVQVAADTTVVPVCS